MRKTRKITKEEEYGVCDLCGEEILAGETRSKHEMKRDEEIGNDVFVMKKYRDLHEKCVENLIIKALKK